MDMDQTHRIQAKWVWIKLTTGSKPNGYGSNSPDPSRMGMYQTHGIQAEWVRMSKVVRSVRVQREILVCVYCQSREIELVK